MFVCARRKGERKSKCGPEEPLFPERELNCITIYYYIIIIIKSMTLFRCIK